jgi:hypothetical protein
MIAVTLTDYELVQAATTGMLRQVSAIKREYNSAIKGKEWQAHIEGACGEVAVAKAMGRYWGGSVNTFKSGGDLDGTGWEVRTRSEHDYDLIVRDDDPDDRVFILVTGIAPDYQVRGWMKAADAKRQEWRKDYGGHGAAFFVPSECLREMGDLR